MEKEKLLDYVAPCALLCYTCMGYKDGPMAACAKRLRVYHEGVRGFRGAALPEEARGEWYAYFDAFDETLGELGRASCPGCRENQVRGNGCIPGCVIPACTKARGVDFCAECADFPCDAARDFFDTHAAKVSGVWESGSRRIREVGVEAYFAERKDVSHYAHYKEDGE